MRHGRSNWSRQTQVQPTFVLSLLVTVHTSAANLCSVRVGHGTHKCSQPFFSHCWSRYTQVHPTFVLSVLVTAHTSTAHLCSVSVGHGTHKCSQSLFCQCWSRYTKCSPPLFCQCWSWYTQVQSNLFRQCWSRYTQVQPAFVLSVLVTVHTSTASLCSVSVGHGTHKYSPPLFCQCWSQYTKCSPPLFSQCWSQYVAITDRCELVRCLTLGVKETSAKASWKFRNITRSSVLEVVKRK